MPTLSFEDARSTVLSTVRPGLLRVESVPLEHAAGRVLAEPLIADRDYPPAARSVRDGFAVRAEDTPGTFQLIGEVRAGGTPFAGAVGPHQAVAIMTGAPLPSGADAIVMIEHTTHDAASVTTERALKPGENFNIQGCEAKAGQTVISPGIRIGYTEIGLAATYGKSTLSVYTQPRVAVLATGDEIVSITETPLAYQIRNSNTWSICAQVSRAGGIPDPLPVAPDNLEATRALIARGLEADLLLLSGGVSAGKYDLVEQVLSEFGAQFHFDRVLIQPGQPLVFGEAQGKYFFGLPGNPASTMITFELFARAAVEILGGIAHPELHLLFAHLTEDFKHRAGLTRFLPAHLDGCHVTPIGWAGSSDVGAMARANAYLVASTAREFYAKGDSIRVLLK